MAGKRSGNGLQKSYRPSALEQNLTTNTFLISLSCSQHLPAMDISNTFQTAFSHLMFFSPVLFLFSILLLKRTLSSPLVSENGDLPIPFFARTNSVVPSGCLCLYYRAFHSGFTRGRTAQLPFVLLKPPIIIQIEVPSGHSI